MCSIPDKPGALFATLELLAQSNINMKKIESRPRKSKPWEYVFFIDIEGHQVTKPDQFALAAAELLDQPFRDCRQDPLLESAANGVAGLAEQARRHHQ